MDPKEDNNPKKEKKPSKFKKIQKIIKKFGMLAPLLKPLIAILILSSVLSTIIYAIASIFSKETPEQIYEDLAVKDFTDFIVIKGDEENGYHLELVEDAETKIDKLVQNLETKSGKKIIDRELLMKMIQAEAVTQYPNLGGTITDPDTQFQGNVKLTRVTPNKTIGELKDTSSGEKTSQDIVQIVDDSEKKLDHTNTKNYVIGIMAGYSQDSPGGRSPTPEGKEKQLKEEEMTIKVANYIQQIFSIYSNVKIIQIGSTIDNPNVSEENRLQTAKEAGVDALIGINFNSFGDGTSYNNTNGVEITYNKDGGSDETKQFGSILKEKVTTNMDLSIGVDNEKESNVLGTKDDSFISLMIHGGYLTSKKDYAILSTDRGLQNYAKGVVDAILEYYEISNIGYGSIISGTTTIASTIDSTIYNLNYVPLDVLESHIENNPEKAIKEFSLDESKNLITATWNYSDGTVKVTKNSTPMSYRSVIGKYTMPIEYLLFFYIDTNKREFVMNLADLAISSEYIITVQDNITTTKVTEVTNTIKTTYKKELDAETQKEVWNQDSSNSTENTNITITENCNSKLELTYADAWFVKFQTEFMTNNQTDTKEGMSGKVTNVESQSENSDINTGYRYIIKEGEEQSYKDETKTLVTTTTTSISNQYETGEGKAVEDSDKFIKIFTDKENGVKGLVKEKWLFQYLEDNTKTAGMVDLTKYLIYKATGVDYGVIDYDFEQYEKNTFNSISYGGTDISLTTSVLDRETFILALQDYYNQTLNENFNKNFLSRAGDIYDWGVKYNINPELIVTMALKESGFKSSGNNQNFWGWGTPNGSGLAYISSFEEGVQKLASTFSSYMVGGSKEGMIENRYNERSQAGCNSNGYGHAGTLKGMLSVYSDLCGDNLKHREGNSGDGGNYYLKVIYGDQFAEKCGNVHKIGVDDYTVQEKADYTAWLYEQQLKYWQKIFGNYGTLASGGTIVQEAINIHKYVREKGYRYAQAGITVPNENGSTIDCSSFVTWVLVNAKVEGFTEGMYQWTSSTFMSNPLGWEEVSAENAQPGDILVYSGHVEFVAGTGTADRFLVYNCGSDSSIGAIGTREAPETSYGRNKSTVSKILRVPQS